MQRSSWAPVCMWRTSQPVRAFPRLTFFVPFMAVGVVLREVARRKGLLGGDGGRLGDWTTEGSRLGGRWRLAVRLQPGAKGRMRCSWSSSGHRLRPVVEALAQDSDAITPSSERIRHSGDAVGPR